jgi:hypothetical protein
MKDVLIQVNKYPYFLFLTYKKEAKYDEQNQKVVTDIKQSRLEKVPAWKIALLKYFPILLILYFSTIPKTQEQLLVFGATILYLSIFIALIEININLMKLYAVVTSIIAYYMLFKVGGAWAIWLNWFVGYFLTLALITYLIFDIVHKKYQGYYKLIDIDYEDRINLTKKAKRPLIPLPFSKNKRGLFKVSTGLNLGFGLRLNGYFIRILEK